MVDFSFLSIDFDKLITNIGKALFSILKIPLRIIHGLPDWAKIVLYCLLALMVLLVAILLWKYRNEWENVVRI